MIKKNFNSNIRQSRSRSYRPTFFDFIVLEGEERGGGRAGGRVLVDDDDDLAAHRVFKCFVCQFLRFFDILTFGSGSGSGFM
jgi:hypothetical protein